MSEGQFLGTHTLVGNKSNKVEKHTGAGGMPVLPMRRWERGEKQPHRAGQT
jgi:hypothetical protein